jgi:hypothetical protein
MTYTEIYNKLFEELKNEDLVHYLLNWYNICENKVFM